MRRGLVVTPAKRAARRPGRAGPACLAAAFLLVAGGAPAGQHGTQSIEHLLQKAAGRRFGRGHRPRRDFVARQDREIWVAVDPRASQRREKVEAIREKQRDPSEALRLANRKRDLAGARKARKNLIALGRDAVALVREELRDLSVFDVERVKLAALGEGLEFDPRATLKESLARHHEQISEQLATFERVLALHERALDELTSADQVVKAFDNNWLAKTATELLLQAHTRGQVLAMPESGHYMVAGPTDSPLDVIARFTSRETPRELVLQWVGAAELPGDTLETAAELSRDEMLALKAALVPSSLDSGVIKGTLIEAKAKIAGGPTDKASDRQLAALSKQSRELQQKLEELQGQRDLLATHGAALESDGRLPQQARQPPAGALKKIASALKGRPLRPEDVEAVEREIKGIEMRLARIDVTCQLIAALAEGDAPAPAGDRDQKQAP